MAVGSIRQLGPIALTIVVVILGAVIGLAVLAGLFPTYAGSVADISENFTTTDWGHATANSISEIFGLVVPIVGLLAIVGLVFLVVQLRRGGGI